jgi:chromosome segregation ATPase
MKSVAVDKNANNKTSKDSSSLWEKVTNEAKDEVLKLRNSFESQLQERNCQISSTKKELDKAKLSAERYNAALADMTRQRDEKLKEISKLQKHVAEQNEKLSGYVKEISALNRDLQERNEVISRYESSYCGLISLSCTITRNRVQNAGKQMASFCDRIKDFKLHRKENVPPEAEDELALSPECQTNNATISF